MSCRAVSSARSRDRTCIYGRHNNRVAHLYISQASTSIYVYINIYLTCASRYTGGHTHTHKMSPAASSARAIAHTCTWRRCIHIHTRTKCHRPHRRHAQSHTRGHGHAHSQPIHHRSIHRSIDIGPSIAYVCVRVCVCVCVCVCLCVCVCT